MHLKVFRVTSMFLYDSSPTFRQVWYSHQDTSIVNGSVMTGVFSLQTFWNVLNCFQTEWFLQFWEKVKACTVDFQEWDGGRGSTCHPKLFWTTGRYTRFDLTHCFFYFKASFSELGQISQEMYAHKSRLNFGFTAGTTIGATALSYGSFVRSVQSIWNDHRRTEEIAHCLVLQSIIRKKWYNIEY